MNETYFQIQLWWPRLEAWQPLQPWHRLAGLFDARVELSRLRKEGRVVRLREVTERDVE